MVFGRHSRTFTGRYVSLPGDGGRGVSRCLLRVTGPHYPRGRGTGTGCPPRPRPRLRPAYEPPPRLWRLQVPVNGVGRGEGGTGGGTGNLLVRRPVYGPLPTRLPTPPRGEFPTGPSGRGRARDGGSRQDTGMGRDLESDRDRGGWGQRSESR